MRVMIAVDPMIMDRLHKKLVDLEDVMKVIGQLRKNGNDVQ